eukprot:g18287.t1
MKKAANCNKSDLKEIRNPKEGDFLRKGVVGDWRNMFTPEQINQYRAVYDARVPGIFRAAFQDYEQWLAGTMRNGSSSCLPDCDSSSASRLAFCSCSSSFSSSCSSSSSCSPPSPAR